MTPVRSPSRRWHPCLPPAGLSGSPPYIAYAVTYPRLLLRENRPPARPTFRPGVESLDALVLPNVIDWLMGLLPDLSFLALLFTPSGTALPAGSAAAPE